MAADLHLNAEGKLDFRNIRKRIENYNRGAKKKPRHKLHITCRFMYSSIPVYLFLFLCCYLFYAAKIECLVIPTLSVLIFR